MRANTHVVVSYWAERSPAKLHKLLSQMTRFNPGAQFELTIVCNGGNLKPLSLPSRFNALSPRILNRENIGYNLGAWECGWRSDPDGKYFLFLQDECFLKKEGWISEFEFRMTHDPGIGLLGESIMWEAMSWPYIRKATDRDLGTGWYEGEIHPLERYAAFMAAQGIPLGVVGTHLQSLILFTSKSVLEEVGGFPFGLTYSEAVGAEIGFSRLIESKGYRISKIKDAQFQLIGHSQWTPADRFRRNFRRRLATPVKRLIQSARKG